MSDHADGGVHDDAEDEHEQHLGERPEVADRAELRAAGDQLYEPDRRDGEHERALGPQRADDAHHALRCDRGRSRLAGSAVAVHGARSLGLAGTHLFAPLPLVRGATVLSDQLGCQRHPACLEPAGSPAGSCTPSRAPRASRRGCARPVATSAARMPRNAAAWSCTQCRQLNRHDQVELVGEGQLRCVRDPKRQVRIGVRREVLRCERDHRVRSVDPEAWGLEQVRCTPARDPRGADRCAASSTRVPRLASAARSSSATAPCVRAMRSARSKPDRSSMATSKPPDCGVAVDLQGASGRPGVLRLLTILLRHVLPDVGQVHHALIVGPAIQSARARSRRHGARVVGA